MNSYWGYRICLLGLAVLFMLALTGCQGKQEANVSAPSPSEPATSAPLQAEETPTTLNMAKGSVHIDQLGERRIFVYLPPGYESGEERYPVVYMHDGSKVFETNSSFGSNNWKVDTITDQLIADGKMEKVIVIGVEASEGAGRGKEYVAFPEPSIPSDGTGAEKFTNYFIGTVIPYVDGAYRTLPDREHRMIMGASFGGIQALWMGYHHPEVFSSIGALSPSTWVGNGQPVKELTKGAGKPDLKIWLDIGIADNMPIDPLLDVLVSKGFVYGQNLFYQLDSRGTHDEASWSRRVHSPLLMFTGKAAEQTVKLEVSDFLMFDGPEAAYLRLNPVATMDNGMDYSVSDGLVYKVLNPEVGRVDNTGKTIFLEPENLNVEVTYQGITAEHEIDYDRNVKLLKFRLKSLVIEERGNEFKILLKPSAEKLKTTTSFIADSLKSLEKIGCYKIKEVQEEFILIAFKTK